MEPERWRKIEELFHAALEREEPRRAAYLVQACAGDDDLREIIERLLARHHEAGDFLESPALQVLAQELAGKQALASTSARGEASLLGQTVSRYRVLEKLGGGGMGVAYKAKDTQLGRLVALKFLRGALSKDPQALERLKREARAASALNHPNIITIHEIGEQDGRTFIVMELVDGKPLNEMIPRKGMRLNDALRIAAQVADALTAAHAAGVVHRDLKPANIMVDEQGRVKVLDFGLAKHSSPVAIIGADEATRTLTMDHAVTEEGVILGSVPYMSPEQAEGKVVDARSDIFSFGAVLYEMITGQRAFRGESRASALAAVVEQDPRPISEISPATPSELERLIVRCLRKDVNRRSQHMSDVKLALEELRDESESGKLARRGGANTGGGRRWLWPAVAVTCVMLVAALTWVYVNYRPTHSRGPDLARVSPDDGHSYRSPAISPDGGFVAYVSDRSGKDELWLQQVGGGDPIQLTHSSASVSFPAFYPDGKRICYIATSADGQRSTIEVISALGGEPKVLVQAGPIRNWDPMLSPDGRLIAYFEKNQGGAHLMTIASNGGQPRELQAWARMPGAFWGRSAWTSDSRHLLCLASKSSDAANSGGWEWFAIPVDGGSPLPTGAGVALRAAGLDLASPVLMTGNRALFLSQTSGRFNPWEIPLAPGSWRVQGAPHRLTSGTLWEIPTSVSGTGTVALEVSKAFNNLYLIPLSPATGQPTGATRRLTLDGRRKWLPSSSFSRTAVTGGDPGNVYFTASENDRTAGLYSLHLDSGKQATVTADLPLLLNSLAISPDGRHVAYSVREGDSYSIRIGDAGADFADARVLCTGCGEVQGFSPDGRFLFYRPEARVKPDSKVKFTVRLLELASGKNQPWLEHPTDSVFVDGAFSQDSRWLWLSLSPPGPTGPRRRYLIPWREAPIPYSEWTKVPLPDTNPNAWRASPSGDLFYIFEGSKLMVTRFDPLKARFGDHREVRFAPGPPTTLKPNGTWTVRAQGLVFSRDESDISVWLMKLPR